MKQANKPSSYTANFLTSWVPKLLALLCALLIYVSVRYFNMSARTVVIPLDVTMPQDTTIVAESTVPSSVSVVISGNDQLIYIVDPDDIVASADFSDVTESGIARVPVVLSYNNKVFKDASLTVAARPDVVKILFSNK